jgi:hypothetical protein
MSGIRSVAFFVYFHFICFVLLFKMPNAISLSQAVGLVHGAGKGVGSQGDGTVLFVAKGRQQQQQLVQYLGISSFKFVFLYVFEHCSFFGEIAC